MPRDCHQTQSRQTEGAERALRASGPRRRHVISVVRRRDARDHDVDPHGDLRHAPDVLGHAALDGRPDVGRARPPPDRDVDLERERAFVVGDPYAVVPPRAVDEVDDAVDLARGVRRVAARTSGEISACSTSFSLDASAAGAPKHELCHLGAGEEPERYEGGAGAGRDVHRAAGRPVDACDDPRRADARA